MNAEFFDAVADIEKEKGIPREYMYEKIRQAMLTAFRKDTPDCEDNVEVILDEDKKKIEMVVKKTVVARVIDPYVEISEEAAHRISKRAKIGDVVSVPVETKQFGRIAAQAAKQVIIQGIREAERGMIYEEFNSKEHEILTGVVNKIDPRTGCAFLKISSNSDYTEAMLAPAECIRGEVLHEGDRIKVYVVEVRNSTRGPQVLISRTHPGLVKRLFELEVPEIFDGARSRSSPSPVRPAAARRWPSGRRIRSSTRSAPASARRAAVSRASSMSSAARRSTSSSTARCRRNSSRPRWHHPRCWK